MDQYQLHAFRFLQAVKARAHDARLPVTFHGAQDHANTNLQGYKLFVNPSISDVVATTSAEALAMGKFVLCAHHPSNTFFSTFTNCLIYHTPEEFSEKLSYALAHDPAPMSPQEIQRLTWEHATQRFMDAALLQPHERPNGVERALDNFCAATHNALTGFEPLRVNAGAGPNTMHTPQRVTDYVPGQDCGGLFDNKERANRVYRK